ncbi:glycosyltransferase family 4 protein [Algoriphagus aestuarii]|nr:glycosyltransferase family 4 protein [Algoriphagus aestuarii]
MKVVFTQDALVNAGAEKSHLEILSRFSKEVEILFVYFYSKHDLREEYERAGIRLIFLDIPESYNFLLAGSRFLKLIQREKPDLLISSLWRADIITRVASLLTGVPLVGTLVNDSYGPFAWKDKIGLKYKVVYWLDRLTAWIPKYWIANAEALAESHVKTLGLDKDKIKVVYRGRNVPEEFWSKDRLREIGLRRDMPSAKYSQDLDLGSPTFNFISYGRLLERKGFQDVINAFREVIQKYPECTLTIFGEGTYRSELEKLVQDLNLKGSIFLPGKIHNPISALINGYYPLPTDPCQLITANCFVFPSWYEGFSGALVEAMMAGIPIIASNISMNLEAVSRDNSMIFEVRNTNQLAQQMIFAIENPDLMVKLGDNARKEALERFDIEKIAKQYEETLKEIEKRIKR